MIDEPARPVAATSMIEEPARPVAATSMIEEPARPVAATERSQRMIRGNDNEEVARLSQSTESTPLAPRIELTTPPGAVLSSTNAMIDNKAQAAAQTNMTIINASSGGGGGKSSGNVNSATAITNNISQGISADDFLRRDFVNGF
jgi:hypothetical protein